MRTIICGLLVLSTAQLAAQKGDKAAAQEPVVNVLPVNGRITDGDNKLAGATITVFRGNDKLEQVVTDRSGRYRVNVPVGDMHTLEFAAQGRMPKRVVMDTRADLPNEHLLFAPMVMDVSLLANERYAGADTDVLDMPYAIVQWDDKVKAFVQDEKYQANMMRTNGALLLMAGRATKE